MNNRIWILGWVAAFSLQASAGDLRASLDARLQSLAQAEDTTTPAAPSPVPAPRSTPIRQAKLRAKIVKNTVGKGPDGNYVFSGTDVCSQEVIINVFDFRSASNSNITDKDILSFACPSTYLGGNVTLRMSGIVFLVNGVLFDKAEDYKFAWAMLTDATTKPSGLAPDIGSVASRDLDAHSMLSFVQPINQFDCSKDDGKGGKVCAPANNEYFSATIEIQD